jgi:hypothetical protein
MFTVILAATKLSKILIEQLQPAFIAVYSQ